MSHSISKSCQTYLVNRCSCLQLATKLRKQGKKKRKYPFGWPFLPTEKGFPGRFTNCMWIGNTAV